MLALRLALSLIRIPRLFVSLLLLPLLFSLILVHLQLLITGIYIQANSNNLIDIEERIKRAQQSNLTRQLIFGNSKNLPPIRICRWIEKTDSNGEMVEVPPTPDCAPDRLDVAIQTNDPATYPVEQYSKIFDNVSERLHVCRSCEPDITIHKQEPQTRTHLRSVWGLMLLSLIYQNEEIVSQYVRAVRSTREIKNKLGDIFLYSAGLRQPVSITNFNIRLAVVFNLAILAVITIWLALRAHRKVLDYFARSGVLLPMVAAIGKSSFYGAIWILTFARVGAFLIAAVPATYFGLKQILKKEEFSGFFISGFSDLTLWGTTIVIAFLLAIIVSSVAELKHRHNFFNFLYRYLPLLLSAAGLILWTITFLFDGSMPAYFRHIVTAVPILGMGPVLLAPIFKPNNLAMIINAIATSVILVLVIKVNSRWFAAHLEDL